MDPIASFLWSPLFFLMDYDIWELNSIPTDFLVNQVIC